MNKDIIKKIYICLKYQIIGDTIGFDNGEQKFNLKYDGILTKKKNPDDYIEISSDTCNSMIFFYLSNGLLNGVINSYFSNQQNNISYISKLNISILESFNKTNNIDDLVNNFKETLLKNYTQDKLVNSRHYSKDLQQNINRLVYKKNINKKYDINQNDSDVASRSLLYGIYFNKLDDIIDIVIKSGKITHSNGIALLGGISTALFTYFIIKKIKINLWIYELLKIIKSNKFKNIYLNNVSKDEIKYYIHDLDFFISKINEYIEYKFDKNKKINKNIAFLYPNIRFQYYFIKYSNDKSKFYPGNNGLDSIIIVYDCLLDTIYSNGNNYETLISYTAFNTGNSNTLCSIALALYNLLEKDKYTDDFILFEKIIKELNYIKKRIII